MRPPANPESLPAPSFRERLSWQSHSGWAALFLVVMTVMAYWPALHGNFIWDDNDHISANLMLRSPRGLWEIWFKPGATCQYYPLTFTVFWAGYQLWGLNPPGYHLLNVLLHGGVAVLLWQVLARLKVRGAWLAGAIFALHPVCVMSVAWMTELKNTLSAALALGAAWAYLRFAGLGVYAGENGENIQHSTSNTEQPIPEPAPGDRPRNSGKRWWLYALALGLFQLALMAKTAVAFLPVTLLLVAWWRRERLRWRDGWPLIPLLGLVVVMGRLTFNVERLHGALGKEFNLGFLERVLVSGRSFWFYLGKLFFPHPLPFIYERWPVEAGMGWPYLYPLATAGALAGLWWSRRRLGKGLFVAFMHFYVCTSLLILLTVLYMTRYAFVSDHWQYFGCMSVIALAAAGLVLILERFAKGKSPPVTRGSIAEYDQSLLPSAATGRGMGARLDLHGFMKLVLCGALLTTLGVLTWRQCGMYADLETLWRTTLARNPRCFLAHNNLGELLAQRGSVAEAASHFQAALDIQPDFVEAHYNLGNVLVQQGQWDGAIAEFQKTLAGQPDFAEAHNNLGNILFEKGQLEMAMNHFRTALQIQPDFAEAHYNLGKALLETGQGSEARVQVQAALKLQPDNPDALSLLAWVLATWPEASVRNGAQAVKLAQRANELSGGGNPLVLRTLAAAYAEAGRFAEAIASARQAVQLAEAGSNVMLADAFRLQLKGYQAGSPFRVSVPVNTPVSPARP
jgi:protein O-mannosyl-transferase